MGVGNEREGQLHAKRETNKQKREMVWGGAEGVFYLSVPLAGLRDAKLELFCPVVYYFVAATSHAGKILVIPHIFYPQKRLPCPELGD